MEEGESITSMFTRFTYIKNGFKALGRDYSIEDNVQKVLRSLLESWHAKSTAIEEAKDLLEVTLDELIGSLMTYGIKKKNATLEVEKPKKTLGITLKVASQKEMVEEEVSDNEDEEGDKKKNKAMNATGWDELDGTSTEGEFEDEVANFCFMADDQDEVCLKTTSMKNKRFLDNGCSRHMTGDANKFASLTYKKEGFVTFEITPRVES
ncbi:uncharacterized protein LOC131160879 [Malania oleifera]|uniref:uncharacterized protein LOC131160879 n=1 Tax=Malania oleifera TaxID=397392 RepID=UPI0025AE49FE|nr:uncharacterized protein LOC131160879 [Malania oleifera]